jgi:RNA polymerase sigma-70 factor (ECF subfamily)
MKNEEKDLIYKAQQGNAWAFEKLIKSYDRRVLALAYQLLGNPQDAEDVYQEVFMRVYKKIHLFRFESDFYTWVYRIAVNCAISYRKKRNRHVHARIGEADYQETEQTWVPADIEPGPDKKVLDSEIKEQIESSLNQLPLMQRVVFILRFFQDFKIREIANIINCSEGTVKNYIFRSTQKMRKRLAPYVQS